MSVSSTVRFAGGRADDAPSEHTGSGTRIPIDNQYVVLILWSGCYSTTVQIQLVPVDDCRYSTSSLAFAVQMALWLSLPKRIQHTTLPDLLTADAESKDWLACTSVGANETQVAVMYTSQ